MNQLKDKIIYDNKKQLKIDSLTTGNIYTVVFKMRKGSIVLDDNGQQVYLEYKYQKDINKERIKTIDKLIQDINQHTHKINIV